MYYNNSTPLCLLIIILITAAIWSAGAVYYREKEQLPWGKAYLEALKSLIDFFSSSSPEYEYLLDEILSNALLEGLSRFDLRLKEFIYIENGFSPYCKLPYIKLDFVPKNATNAFPVVRKILKDIFHNHMVWIGKSHPEVHVAICPDDNASYVIYIYYATTEYNIKSFKKYVEHLRKEAKKKAAREAMPVKDKKLEDELAGKKHKHKGVTKNIIKIGTDLETRTPITADISKTGHICIAGSTGSGKTMAVLWLLYNILNLYVKLFIGDFKKSGDYKGITDNFAEFDKVATLIDDFYTEFEQTEEGSKTIKILLIDEYAGFITWLMQKDKKRCEEIKGKISNLLMLGRSRHCYVWTVQQRISAQLFPSGCGAVDNYQIVLGLGHLSVDSRRAMFAGEHLENEEFEASFQPGTGQGLCMADGQPLKALQIPKISDTSRLKHLLREKAQQQ